MEENEALAVVTTLPEIIDQIRVWNHQQDELWFRGQSDSRWPLQPGAYRLPFRQQSESSFVEHFRRLAASDAMRFGLDEWDGSHSRNTMASQRAFSTGALARCRPSILH